MSDLHTLQSQDSDIMETDLFRSILVIDGVRDMVSRNGIRATLKTLKKHENPALSTPARALLRALKTKDKVRELAATMEAAMQKRDVSVLVDGLSQLESIHITLDLLRKINIGKIVSQLKKDDDPRLRAPAKLLHKKWKRMVSELAEKEAKGTKSKGPKTKAVKTKATVKKVSSTITFKKGEHDDVDFNIFHLCCNTERADINVQRKFTLMVQFEETHGGSNLRQCYDYRFNFLPEQYKAFKMALKEHDDAPSAETMLECCRKFDLWMTPVI